MADILVRNKKGTSNRKLPEGYGSWLDYWKDKRVKSSLTAEVLFDKLQCIRCPSDKNLVGAHVMKVDAGDQRDYITCLCVSCNNLSNEKAFLVREELLVLVE